MNNISKTLWSCICVYILSSFLTSIVVAQDIALFYNDNYTQISEGKIFAEGSNLRTTLDHMDVPYSLTTDIDFGILNSISADGYLILPELEVRDLSQDLSNGATQRMLNFVHAGGNLVVIGTVGVSRKEDFNCAKLLNKVFNLQLDIEKFDWKIRGEGEIDQATNEEWPKNIPLNNSTILFPKDLPSNATSLYKAIPSGNSIALDIKIGEGSILYLGWSWWNALPIGVQDGGWSELLEFILKPKCEAPDISEVIRLERATDGIATLARDDIEAFESNCSKQMTLTFDKTTFICGDFGLQKVQATWSNEEGIQFEMDIQVDVPACLVPLSEKIGSVVDMDGAGIDDVLARFSHSSFKTNAEGTFDIPMDSGDGMAHFSLNKEDRAGRLVDMVDLILLNRYLSDPETYPLTAHQKIAADVNADEHVGHGDLKYIRAMLGQRIQQWPTEASNWVFVKKNLARSLEQPLQHTNEQRFTFNLSEEIELVGIKRGNLSSLDKLEGRTNNTIVIQDIPLKQLEDQWVEIPIDFYEIEGVSLSFFIDPAFATIVDVDLPKSLDSKTHYWSRGELLVEGVIREPFTIRVKLAPSVDVNSSKIIHMGSLAKSKVYLGHAHEQLDVETVQITFEAATKELQPAGIHIYPTVVEDILTIVNQEKDKKAHQFHIYGMDGKLLGTTTVGAHEKKLIKKEQLVNYFGLAIVHCIDCTINTNHKIIITK